MPDEVIRPSLKLIKACYLMVVLLIVAAVIVHAMYLADRQPWLPAIAVVLLIWPVQRQIRRQFVKTTMGADRLRCETGFLSKSTRTIQLTKIQDVRVDQSLAQRILGIGDISIETAGETSRLTIVNIDNPQQVADRIMAASQHGHSAEAAQ